MSRNPIIGVVGFVFVTILVIVPLLLVLLDIVRGPTTPAAETEGKIAAVAAEIEAGCFDARVAGNLTRLPDSPRLRELAEEHALRCLEEDSVEAAGASAFIALAGPQEGRWALQLVSGEIPLPEEREEALARIAWLFEDSHGDPQLHELAAQWARPIKRRLEGE